MKKVELLAPAGNMDALIAAVNGGCDAVYLGLKSFSARAFAGNFSHEEFIEAIHYCHTRNVKIYCTINTMLFESEIENAKKEVDFLYENDCDAILIQDLGLFHYVRTCYPDMPVHCSTQMHIHNLKGVELMKKEGVERVVLARETPIEVIREACKTGVEIEVFSYGAICISYSGECMMSSAVKNRSANRGMCAQCCRLQYFKEDGSSFSEGNYPLSPKDLNVIDRLPELLDAGVSSLKIEGRMKRSEYVWLVTKTFREAIDAYYENKPYHISHERMEQLKYMFNRGFSEGHIFHSNVNNRMSQYRPNHQGVEIGKVLAYQKGKVQVQLTKELNQHDGLRIINTPHDTGLTATKIYKKDKLVNHAEAGEVVWISCPSDPIPKKGQSLHKTTDTKLISWIDDQILHCPKRIPVTIEYDAKIGKPFNMLIKDYDGHTITSFSDQILEEAKNAPINALTIEKSLRKTGEYPYIVEQITGEIENVFIPVSIMNETRRKAFESLDQIRTTYRINQGKKDYHFNLKDSKNDLPRIIYESDCIFEEKENMLGYHHDQKPYVLPVIDETNSFTKKYDNAILSSVCDLNNDLHDCIAGMTMNIANSYSLAYVLSKGVSSIIFSSEMNNEQIEVTLSAFQQRYGFIPKTYRLVYGKRVAMYIKERFIKDNIENIMDLNHQIYEIKQEDNITEILEPNVYVSKNPHCYGSYLILNEKEEKNILEECYEELFK